MWVKTCYFLWESTSELHRHGYFIHKKVLSGYSLQNRLNANVTNSYNGLTTF